MREIKFRAKNNETGNWDYYDGCYDFWYGLNDGQYSYETLSQYTGIKDKNGKEIYEGDVAEIGHECDLNGRYEIKYHDGEWRCFNNGKYYYDARTLKCSVCNKVEVIGNIYENPELLKDNNE